MNEATEVCMGSCGFIVVSCLGIVITEILTAVGTACEFGRNNT
jgi:hypothetical protein